MNPILCRKLQWSCGTAINAEDADTEKYSKDSPVSIGVRNWRLKYFSLILYPSALNILLILYSNINYN